MLIKDIIKPNLPLHNAIDADQVKDLLFVVIRQLYY